MRWIPISALIPASHQSVNQVRRQTFTYSISEGTCHLDPHSALSCLKYLVSLSSHLKAVTLHYVEELRIEAKWFPKCYSWIFIGRTDAEAQTPIIWPPDAENWLIRKDPDAGQDWIQEEKGMTEDYGWMASLTWWTWVWASSGSWWWTELQP